MMGHETRVIPIEQVLLELDAEGQRRVEVKKYGVRNFKSGTAVRRGRLLEVGWILEALPLLPEELPKERAVLTAAERYMVFKCKLNYAWWKQLRGSRMRRLRR